MTASENQTADRSEERHFTNYHRVLNRVKWNSLQGSRILLGLLLAMFPSPGAIVLGVDFARDGPTCLQRRALRRQVRRSSVVVAKRSSMWAVIEIRCVQQGSTWCVVLASSGSP